MNKIFNFLRFLFKWICILLAIGNLLFLFLFDYQIPDFLRPYFSSDPILEETEAIEAETAVDPTITIEVPSHKLEYDGSDDLDLMDGVSVIDISGIARKEIQVFVSMKAGNTRKEKIIEYSATDENGNRVTAERKLSLIGSYSGPFIEILGEMPSVMDDELPSLASLLADEGLIRAEDGFGRDVTTSVTSSIKSEDTESGECIVTLSITNMLNDTYSTEVTVSTQFDGPMLKLTTDKITLNTGDSFSFYEYIAAAQDEDGNSLFESISMKGSVDTYTPGEYVLEFYCTDASGTPSPSKKLTVIVK